MRIRHVTIICAFSLGGFAFASTNSGGDYPGADAESRQLPLAKIESVTMEPINPVSAGELVAGRYKVTAILEIYKGEDLESMVGLIDARSGQSFLLSGKKTYDDLQLVSADYEKQEVVLRNKNVLYSVNMIASTAGLPAAVAQPALRRPGVMGTPNPREAAAQALRRARYAQPPPGTTN